MRPRRGCMRVDVEDIAIHPGDLVPASVEIVTSRASCNRSCSEACRLDMAKDIEIACARCSVIVGNARNEEDHDEDSDAVAALTDSITVVYFELTRIIVYSCLFDSSCVEASSSDLEIAPVPWKAHRVDVEQV
jgi:hypothetical protein